MNRVDLLRAYEAHKAAAAACERALKTAVEEEFHAQGMAVTQRAPGVGRIETSVTRPVASVADLDRFLDWVEKRHPTEVTTEVVTVRAVRNVAWQERLLAGLAPVDPDEIGPGEQTLLMDDDGEVVPGVMWRQGGGFRCASIVIEPDLKRVFADAARAYVEEGAPLPISTPTRPALPGR